MLQYPSIVSLRPSYGPVAGGTRVEISLDHLEALEPELIRAASHVCAHLSVRYVTASTGDYLTKLEIWKKIYMHMINI